MQVKKRRPRFFQCSMELVAFPRHYLSTREVKLFTFTLDFMAPEPEFITKDIRRKPKVLLKKLSARELDRITSFHRHHHRRTTTTRSTIDDEEAPSDAGSVEEEEAMAATRLQAARRGQQGRREVGSRQLAHAAPPPARPRSRPNCRRRSRRAGRRRSRRSAAPAGSRVAGGR